MGSRLDDECSVIQSLPGDYIYVKWWDSGPILRDEPCKDESGIPKVAPKDAAPVFM